MRRFICKSDRTGKAVRLVVYALSLMMVWEPALLMAAEITTAERGNGHPVMDNAGNGVPIVNIRNPNDAGVSSNYYQDFNVGQNGLILNNGRKINQTQLGGYIAGNPNLSSGSASVILNQVVGSNKSNLDGYMEVGGQKADVVVANPNGISCDGCGFINTNHATLSTGIPLMDDQGNITGFDVRHGLVSVGSGGLNAGNVNRFDIIARSVKLAGEIDADNLNIITGRQKVDRDSLATADVQTDSDSPEFAIDASELGGMYANRIRLIANEDGVGVRLNAPVASQTGNIDISSTGQLQFKHLSSAADMSINTSSLLDINGTASADGKLDMRAPSVKTDGSVSAGELSIDSDAVDLGEDGSFLGVKSMSLETHALSNEGTISSKIVDIESNKTIDNGGTISAQSSLVAKGLNVQNSGSLVSQAGLSVNAVESLINSGSIIGGASNLSGSGSFMNQGTIQTAEGDVSGFSAVTNNGKILSTGNLTLSEIGSVTDSGLMSSDSIMKINADDLTLNKTGTIQSGENMAVRDTDALINQGELLSLGNLSINAPYLKNERTADANGFEGTLASAGDLVITATDLDNLNGAVIGSGGNMNLLIPDALNNDQSDITAQGKIVIAANKDLGKNVKVVNHEGRIKTKSGDVYINTALLDNSRNVSLAKTYDVTAQDIKNLMYLHLTANNASLTKDDWTFIYDPDLYKLNPLATNGVYREGWVDHWITQYTSYLNHQLPGILSSADVAYIRQVMRGNKSSGIDPYDHNGEASAITVKGSKNPLAETFYLIPRITQLIKERSPEKYSRLLTFMNNKLKNHTGSLNVWRNDCGVNRADWRAGSEACDNGTVQYFRFGGPMYDDIVDPQSDAVASVISSGGNLFIHADMLKNEFSDIVASGDIALEGDKLINKSLQLDRHFTIAQGRREWHNASHGPSPNWTPPSSYYSQARKINIPLGQNVPSVISSGGNMSLNFTDEVGNFTRKRGGQSVNFDSGDYNVPTVSGGQNSGDSSQLTLTQWDRTQSTRVIDTVNQRTLRLLQGHSAEFIVHGSPDQPYLIESNPLYTHMDQFIGSDYLMSRLGVNPDQVAQRLGDAYYEDQLIRNAIIQATGHRYLDPQVSSDQAQFKQLMDNAAYAAERLHLAVGVALTPAQINSLHKDIVWMEKRQIAGHTVLVPVLYLAPGSAHLTDKGAVIAADNVEVKSNGFANSGAMAANGGMSIQAGNKGVVNLEGTLQAQGALGISSAGSITNQSGTLQAAGMSLASGHNITNESWTSTWKPDLSNGSYQRTTSGRRGVMDATGNMSLASKDDIDIAGSDVSGKNINMVAGKNISVTSQTVGDHFKGRMFGWTEKRSQKRQISSDINASLNLLAKAGANIQIVASNMHAAGNLGLDAENDVLIASAANQSSFHREYHHGDSDKWQTDNSIQQQQSSVGAGGDLDIKAGKDLLGIGSSLESGGDMSVHAGGDIQWLAAKDQEYHHHKSKSEGDFGAHSHRLNETNRITNVRMSLTSGGDMKVTSDGNQTYQAAKLNSEGDVDIHSGGKLTFEAVKDILEQNHQNGQSDSAWQSSSAKGHVDETALQTEIVHQGNLAIDASKNINIDVRHIDGATIREMIDHMVAQNPKLAWLKKAEENDDIDWHQVEEKHKNWHYKNQGLSQTASLAVAIIVAAVTSGVGGSLVGAGGSASGAAASGAAAGGAASGAAAGGAIATAADAGLTSIATTATIDTINNGGQLGKTLESLGETDNLKNFATATITGGLTRGFVDKYFGGTTDPVTQITKGFDLDTLHGAEGFALHGAAQAVTNASIDEAVYGGSFGDYLHQSMETQGNNVLSALAFNQVGSRLDKKAIAAGGNGEEFQFGSYVEGGIAHTLVHAAVGGAVTQVTSGDFRTGAAAAGLNQILSGPLDHIAGGISGGNNGKYNTWRTAEAQLAGLTGANLAGGDPEQGAWIGKQADTYNRQLHKQELKLIADNYKTFAKEEDISNERALKKLIYKAETQVDAGYANDNGLKDRAFIDGYNLDAAGQFLSRLAYESPEIINDDGVKTLAFHATPEEYSNSMINSQQLHGMEDGDFGEQIGLSNQPILTNFDEDISAGDYLEALTYSRSQSSHDMFKQFGEFVAAPLAAPAAFSLALEGGEVVTGAARAAQSIVNTGFQRGYLLSSEIYMNAGIHATAYSSFSFSIGFANGVTNPSVTPQMVPEPFWIKFYSDGNMLGSAARLLLDNAYGSGRK